jgi:hypothetical protein
MARKVDAASSAGELNGKGRFQLKRRGVSRTYTRAYFLKVFDGHGAETRPIDVVAADKVTR